MRWPLTLLGMTRLAWLTDIHLNFLAPAEVEAFLHHVQGCRADALAIGGDIAEAPHLIEHLELLARQLDRPIYFVLGNHDYYFSSRAEVRRQVRLLCRRDERLVWLTDGAVVPLALDTALVGHDGWADAQLGDYQRSFVMMNDYKLIAELAAYSPQSRWPVLKAWGQESAGEAQVPLETALERYEQVYFLTHVPPLREACWHQGQISNDEWLPHFTCYAMGRMLVETMLRHPHRTLTVLCGNTHGQGECQPLANLRILTGGANYGEPSVQQVFECG